MHTTWLKIFFFTFLVRPIVWICLGLHINHRERLPQNGPCIVVANHNSHLDTLVLMSLFPMRLLTQVHPVAAADYFLRTRWLSWIARTLIGIIPISRTGETPKEHLFDDSSAALQRNEILILFPEGTRGEPGKLAPLKKGLYHLARSHPQCRVVPVFLDGLWKALPKGEKVLVPFNCKVSIGEALTLTEDVETFMTQVENALTSLAP